MRTLVTGGAGFIGSALCERLLAAGDEVLCADNFFTGSRRNVAHLQEFHGFEVIRQDVTQAFHVEVDRIFNLACPASPVHYQRNPVRTVKTSVLGAAHLLDLARELSARFLQASTSEVYGDPQVHPQPETYWGHVNPIGPRSCYDEGKRVAETLCFEFHREHGVAVRVVRIFNTYGPRMQIADGRVVSSFVVGALRGEDLVIHGDGGQTRSFCFVDDLVEGLLRMMAQDHDTGPINLGSPVEITIRELAELVLELTGSRSRIVEVARPTDDPSRRCPDIARAQKLLAWTPAVPLRDGLVRTIGYFERALAASPGPGL